MAGIVGSDMSMEDVTRIINGADKGDRGLVVHFDTKEVEDPEKTLEFGYKIYREELYISIQAPGDGSSRIHRKATNCGGKRRCDYVQKAGDVPCDAHRFPEHWIAFQGDFEQLEAGGLPITAWPVLNKAETKMLKDRGIHTVEQLAAIADSSLPALGPIRSIRQKAVDYLELAKGTQPLQKMRAQIEERENELDVLRRTVKEQGDKIQQLMEGKPPPVVPVPDPPRKRA